MTPLQKFEWLGPSELHDINPNTEKKRNSGSSKKSPEGEVHIKKTTGEYSGISPVRLDYRSSSEGEFERYGEDMAKERLRNKLDKFPSDLAKFLQKWVKEKNLARKMTLRFPPPSIVIHTDASLSGWGGHSETRTVQGKWSSALSYCHINVLETMAGLLTLRRLQPLEGAHMRLMMDNSMIVHCRNRSGSKSRSIKHVIVRIMKMCRTHNWHISTFYIQGVRNGIADALSRNAPLESEWTLDKKSFQFVLQLGPNVQIDLFAMSENHQLPLYIAPNIDPKAVGVNVILQD